MLRLNFILVGILLAGCSEPAPVTGKEMFAKAQAACNAEFGEGTQQATDCLLMTAVAAAEKRRGDTADRMKRVQRELGL